MEQKLWDFVRSEIVNRFLAKRSDFPYENPAMLEELSQRVVREMATEMPSLEPPKEVCSLYEEVVDKVADRLVGTFALRSPLGASEKGKGCGTGGDSGVKEVSQQVSQQVTGPERKNGPGKSQDVDLENSRFWHDGLLGDGGGQNWVDDLESCGSIDAARTEQG